MKALVLSLVIALGIGGNYIAQQLTQPILTQQEENIALLEKARRATFMIRLPGYNVSGSATLVGRKKLDNGGYRYTALTAYHLVDEMAEDIAKDKMTADHAIEMMFQPNFHGEPLRVKLDLDDITWAVPSHDWAAIVFDMDHKISCAQLASRIEFKAIQPFEKIYAIGAAGAYGQHCRVGIIGATHNQHGNINHGFKSKWPWDVNPNKFFRPYINIWYGDSGGGIYSREGKLIGIINGFNMLHNSNLRSLKDSALTITFDKMPVSHSTMTFKTYFILDTIQDSKDFFLVED